MHSVPVRARSVKQSFLPPRTPRVHRVIGLWLDISRIDSLHGGVRTLHGEVWQARPVRVPILCKVGDISLKHVGDGCDQRR